MTAGEAMEVLKWVDAGAELRIARNKPHQDIGISFMESVGSDLVIIFAELPSDQ